MPTASESPPAPASEPVVKPAKSAKPTAAELPSVLKVTDTELKFPEAEPTKEYHVGTLESCPFQNVTLHGVAFPRFSGGAAIGDPQRRGARARLSASVLEGIKRSVAKKVCRWRALGADRVGVILNTDTLGFRPQVGDEPLAKHVYCIELAPEVAKALDAEPEAMA